MNRPIAALVVAAAVAAALVGVAAPAGIVAAQDGSTDDGANATTAPSPGERVSGVVAVQGAEVNNEVESRAFEVALRNAENDSARAAVVAARLNRTEATLAELEARRSELRERRETGELSQAAYAARVASTTARAEVAARGLNRSTDVAAELRPDARAERGLDEARMVALRERADELRGPEAAAAARDITGGDVGRPIGPERRGPPNGSAGPPNDVAPGGDAPPDNGSDAGEGEPENGGPPVDAGDGSDDAGDGDSPADGRDGGDDASGDGRDGNSGGGDGGGRA